MSAQTRQSRELVVIEALGSGKNQKDAALNAGLSPRTVARWLETPEFRVRVSAYREQILETQASRLGVVMSEAVDTLSELMQRSSPPAVRLGAARAVLEQSIKLREVLSIEKRLVELEERLISKTVNGQVE